MTATHHHHHTDEEKGVIDEFFYVVNMPIASLERWLDGDESKAVGQQPEAGGEWTGQRSGRRIVELLHKRRADYDEGDIEHMRRVIAYVHHHLAQRPAGDVHDTPWRHSLMNWGHDPLTGRR